MTSVRFSKSTRLVQEVSKKGEGHVEVKIPVYNVN